MYNGLMYFSVIYKFFQYHTACRPITVETQCFTSLINNLQTYFL